MLQYIKLLVCLVLAGGLSACGSSGKEKQTDSFRPQLGKYIYRDDNYIHHIDPNCTKLRHGKDDAGHEIYAKHLMDTSEFVITNIEWFRVCSRCVSDKEYEHILRISENNSSYGDFVY